ncbi:hypothetical protein Poli38472_005430 [Pythium oligandrum]|uniref:FHA domain-containing protein n=1 Tax=Pythium oligandrum TaxID=41045 RepID=A0A8K1CGB0_PYTOL|nr:hypothetical protein Poli38472_005430 [Pythium oligandrum]|eukprot:TMW62812.1 hypothetical protein Poli38472_005430 [Pythium oligandrum]
MKRKQAAEEAKRGNTKAKKNTGVDESVDVQTFFVQDCDAAAKQLVDHAKRRCDELRREFSKSREAILNEIVAQKENLPAEEEEEEPRLACDIVVQCILGPYKGNSYILNMDLEEHPIALIGRSTGKKFRTPHGLSFPKDYEVSTTHGQLRLEPDGQLIFTDLDSTNGSYINDELIDPQQPTPLNPSAPCKLSVGGSELMLSIVKRQ